jgi:Leucine-rich repeat (LRR) protein
LVCLEYLYLNNNKIKKIENLDNNKNLKHLELRSNRIEELSGLKNLTNLHYLTLSCNLIKKIDDDEIGEWPYLIDIGLFGNYLGNINIIQNFQSRH